ncbi:hypothetical protein OA871_04365 [Paracoccaceae bacterium]|jgi:hypothetical protein|nr:hypothetical protein [Paracoccaceae bacterium]|tara:strand:+ start:106 stop:402 length:297 start_codon:yes stop_codon:yes gene_type:complete
MYIRTASIKFPSQEKADAFVAMSKTIWFPKVDKEELNTEQIIVETGEGKILGIGIYSSETDFLKSRDDGKKTWNDFIKSFDGIVEWQNGHVVAHYKRN